MLFIDKDFRICSQWVARYSKLEPRWYLALSHVLRDAGSYVESWSLGVNLNENSVCSQEGEEGKWVIDRFQLAESKYYAG